MFSNHRAPCLFSLIIQSESESVFDQSLALYPGTDKKRHAVQRRGQTQPCIYPCISIPLMIIHVQSLYNSLQEAKCWAFIMEDLSEHYCFCCMKQTLQAIIMIIIICWETRSTQIGSMSVIKRCTPFFFFFGRVGERSFHGAFKIKSLRRAVQNFNVQLMGNNLTPFSQKGSTFWTLSLFTIRNYMWVKAKWTF